MTETAAEASTRQDGGVAFAVDAARRPVVLATALVSFAGLLVEVLHEVLGLKNRSGWLPMLSLSREQNLPTCFAALLLVASGSLLILRGVAARRRAERSAWHWLGLAIAFFYIAFDELAEIHERASFLDLGGVLHFSWVVPASVAVLVLGLVFLPFVWRLPPRTRLRFVIAGTLYVGGALGMELPLGYWTAHHGDDNVGYALIDWVEETMELAGLSVFLLAMLDELAGRAVTLRFIPKDGAA